MKEPEASIGVSAVNQSSDAWITERCAGRIGIGDCEGEGTGLCLRVAGDHNSFGSIGELNGTDQVG